MGEILGWGKPKKKKGKILPLVKKNWNWEFQCNNDIFFILFASLCPLALSPQCRMFFFSTWQKKCPVMSPRFYSRWGLTWPLFQSLKSLEEWLPQFILHQKFTFWPVSYGQRESSSNMTSWLLSCDRMWKWEKHFSRKGVCWLYRCIDYTIIIQDGET